MLHVNRQIAERVPQGRRVIHGKNLQVKTRKELNKLLKLYVTVIKEVIKYLFEF